MPSFQMIKCTIKFYYDSTGSNTVELNLNIREYTFLCWLSGFLENTCDVQMVVSEPEVY